jgi:hypothetical protein
VDAWLLKILVEESLGWPVALVSDLDSRFDGVPSIYQAMVHGDVHIYPEASARPTSPHAVFRRVALVGWSRCGNRMSSKSTTPTFSGSRQCAPGCV